MNVLEFMSEKGAHATRELQELVASYDLLENQTLIQKSSEAFDHLRSYLQIEENLVLPMLKNLTGLAYPLQYAKTVFDEMEYIMEHGIMMHVDEPSLEYKHHLVDLLELLKQYRGYEEQEVLPLARAQFSPEVMASLQEHLYAQTNHESHPLS